MTPDREASKMTTSPLGQEGPRYLYGGLPGPDVYVVIDTEQDGRSVSIHTTEADAKHVCDAMNHYERWGGYDITVHATERETLTDPRGAPEPDHDDPYGDEYAQRGDQS